MAPHVQGCSQTEASGGSEPEISALASSTFRWAGSAIGSVLEKGELATTAELKISFLKPVAKGLVRGEGKVLRKGKRVAFIEATIKNTQDEVVATVSSTWTIVSS